MNGFENFVLLYFLGFVYFSSFHVLSFVPLFVKLMENTTWYKAVLIAIILSQLIFIAFFDYQIGDVMLFSGAGKYLRQGIDFYWIDSDHTQYPFFPLLIYYHAIANYFSEMIPYLNFSFYLKLLLLACAIFISKKILDRNVYSSLALGRKLQIQFLSSPLVYCVVLVHGQVDIALITLLMLSINQIGGQNFFGWLKMLVYYSLSIAAKTWSIIFLPGIIQIQNTLLKKLIFPIGIMFLLLAITYGYTLTVFGSSVTTVLPAVTKAGGPIGVWGISFLFSWSESVLSFLKENSLWIFLFGYLGSQSLLLRKHFEIYEYIALTIISFYILTLNWGAQYLFWVYPFLLVLPEYRIINKLHYFSLITGGYIFIAYFHILTRDAHNLQMIVSMYSLILWIFFMLLFFHLYKKFTES